MSSFLAHSLIGLSLGHQKKYNTKKGIFFVSILFVFLASMPDIDYLYNYFFEPMSIRYTHSIGYVVFVGLFAMILKLRCSLLPVWIFFVIPLSHLLLDFFVGVHGNPYLYPLSSKIFISPFGILPSSGRINLHNYYFWRNMGIELVIFVPILFFSIERFRVFVFKYKSLFFLLCLLFLMGIIISVNLER